MTIDTLQYARRIRFVISVSEIGKMDASVRLGTVSDMWPVVVFENDAVLVSFCKFLLNWKERFFHDREIRASINPRLPLMENNHVLIEQMPFTNEGIVLF